MRRSLATTLGALLACATPVLAQVGTPSASAAEAGPAITAPTTDEQVSAEIEVTVASTAPYVLIAWQPEAALEDWLHPTQTVDGVATARLSTSGYHGPTTITARECATSSVCDGPTTSVQVNVSNPPVAFDNSTWLNEIRDTAVISVKPEGTWAWYGFFFDGNHVQPVFGAPWFPVDPEYFDLADGTHTVQVAHCTQLSHDAIIEPPVCDMAHASEVRSFTVRTALHPEITEVRRRTFSPDGDGAKDEVSVSMTAETNQLVAWQLLQDSQVVAQGPVGEQKPGPYSFVVDGLDAEGQPLPDGRYDLRVSAFSLPPGDPTIDDRMIRGETSTTIRIDTEPPRVTDDSVSPRVFDPRGDSHSDAVAITGTLTERAARVRVQLRRDGAVRRTLTLGREPAGELTVTWDGRRRNGRLMPRGIYRYRFVVRDRAGNEATRHGGWLRLRRG